MEKIYWDGSSIPTSFFPGSNCFDFNPFQNWIGRMKRKMHVLGESEVNLACIDNFPNYFVPNLVWKKSFFYLELLMPNPLQTQSQEMQVFFVKIGRKFLGKRRLGRPPNFGKGIIKSATRYDKVPLSQFLLLPREDDEESLLVNLF